MSDNLRAAFVEVAREVSWMREPGAAEVLDKLLPVVRAALAEAWDDGFNAACAIEPDSDPWPPNPWREVE